MREKKDSLDTTLDHFNNRVKEINIDHGMGLQLGRTYAHDRARGAFGQLRKRLGISWDEIGELVNQYCDYPDRWRIGPGKHPWHDFVSARTQGRLAHELERKRLAAEVAVRNDGAAESKAAEDAARALAWLREQEGTSSSD